MRTDEEQQYLMTAFCGSSAELLLKRVNNCKTLILPNDKVKDSVMLIEAIRNEKFDYVICFGQRPLIKDKVHLETTAREGGFFVDTNFDYEKLKRLLEANGVTVKISHNAGTSFCNKLYLNGLKYVIQNNMETKIIFVHIPFVKNITDFDAFCKKVLDVFANSSLFDGGSGV